MADYTIDLCEGGIASASGYATGYSSSSDRAFNGLTGFAHMEGWVDSALSGWLQYQFTTPKKIEKIRVFSYYSSGIESIDAFTIQASNTGAFSGEQVTLYTGNNPPNVIAFVDYEFSNTNAYTYYRIDVTSIHTEPGNSPTHIGISEVEMMAKIVVDANPRPDNISELYHRKQIPIRGKASEGFIRPTIQQFFTSKDFEEILSGPSYVGQSYGGGFYIGTLGGYYLICSPVEGVSTELWGGHGFAVTGADSLIDGYQNTLDMIADSQDHPAANFCVALTIGGFSDWYLPSKDELALFYANRGVLEVPGLAGSISDLAIPHYWSSSEYQNTYAWYHSPDNGVTYNVKYGNKYARAIRRVAIE